MVRRLGWVAVCAALLLPPCALAQQVPVPPLRARVTDLTATLTAPQAASLEQKLAAFEARKGSQLALLVVATTKPEAIEQYSIRVVERWQLGRKGVDDGALLLVAKNDRELRIEVGLGLEGALTDLIANRIVEDIIVPNFKAGEFYRGINDGLDAMIQVVDGEPLPEPTRGARPRGEDEMDVLQLMGFVLAVIVNAVLRALIGRLPAALVMGALGGTIALFMGASLLVIVIASVLVFLLALGARFAGDGGTGRRGYGQDGWTSDGFSGGGGSFGGGGASGRW